MSKYSHPEFDDIDYRKAAVNGAAKPRLLLHCCCAPCAAGCIERLSELFEVTFYYYNPNITDDEEYVKRFNELRRLGESFGVPAIDGGRDDFFAAVKGLENEPEGGARCAVCFKMRLFKTAEAAGDYDCFATTLTLSPVKNARLINEIGSAAAEKFGTEYIKTDFKKRGGGLRSKALSEELNLYRQNYCGCAFSRNAVAAAGRKNEYEKDSFGQ